MAIIIKLRESEPPGQVIVFDADDGMIHAENEYRGAADWIKREYGLSNTELRTIYKDYKDDYDRRFP